jgi:DnaJ-class molecular chaperone
MALVRKAYKKQALKTHPDTLPAGLSEEEKGNAAEKFREVCTSAAHFLVPGVAHLTFQISHACEILTDPEKRKVNFLRITISRLIFC